MVKNINTIKLIILISILIILIFSFTKTNSYANITQESNTADIIASKIEAGVKVYAYRLTTVNYDYLANQPISPPYEWVENVKKWLEISYPEYVDTEKFAEKVKNHDTSKKFYSELISKIKDETIKLTPLEKEVSGEAQYPVTNQNLTGSVTFENLEMGTYLILIENGYRVYLPSIVNLTPEFNEETKEWELNNQQVLIKSTNPQIKKMVTNDTLQKDNYSTKDIISFTIEADIPTYLNSSISNDYFISDKLSNGLILDNKSIKVYGKKENSPKEELKEQIDFILTTESAHRPNSENIPVDFCIEFIYSQINQFDKIIVEYNASLAKNNSTIIGGAGNINKAYMDYSNNPYEQNSMQSQESGDIKVYTYGIEILKIDKISQEPLKGAEFEISLNNEKLYFIKSDDGKYYQASKEDVGATQTLIVDDNGNLIIYGLDSGEYRLTETKAPTGYNKATNSVPITLSDNDCNGVLDNSQVTTGIVKISFPNSQNFQIPVTGGIGTLMFIISGIIFISIGLVLLSILIKNIILENT